MAQAQQQPKSIRVLQWNCLSFKQRRFQIINLSHDFDVILLCETWLSLTDYASLSGFVVVRNDRPLGRGGGTAISIRNSIPFRIVSTYNSLNNLESNAISITTPQGELLLVSAYRPPNSPFDPSHLQKFLDSLSPFNSIIVAGDFNCHNGAWGSNFTCNLGNHLLSSFSDHNLLVINQGSPTHINKRNPDNPSCIDFTFVSSNLYSICSWSVLEDNFTSDHFPISTFIGIPPPTSTHRSHRPNYRRVPAEKWPIFSDTLSDFTLNPYSSATSNYESLTANILRAINDSVPTLRAPSKRPKPPEPPWWNEECSSAETARKTALRNFRRDPNLLPELLSAEESAKSTFRKAKKKSFQDTCASLTPLSNPKQFWNLIRRFKHRCLNASEARNNTANIQKQLDLIPSICPPSCFLPNFPSSFSPSPSTLNFFCKPFSRTELDISIAKCHANPSSAPGLDRIDNFLISRFPENILNSLLSIFNELFRKGEFPPSWKEFLVFFIPKGNTGKFRPISLAQSLLKLFERMVLRRLTWWLERFQILPRFQFGFRKGKSCLDNLSIFSCSIYTSFINGSFTAAVLLDVKGAFDGVDPGTLAHILRDLGLPWQICRFFYNLSSSISVYFNIGGEIHGPFQALLGVPQGCCGSPSAYNLYTHKLPEHLDSNCQYLCFADDVVLFVSSPDLEFCRSALQKSLDNISSYFNSLGLSIVPQKTQLIVFTHKHTDTSNFSLSIDNSSISCSPQVKLLGVTFDSKLSWSPHFHRLASKCNPHVNLIRSLCGTWWGAHPQSLLQIYKAFVLGSIDYGSIACLPRDKSAREKLAVLQRRALRACLGLRRSTPNRIVYAESCELPIHLRPKKLAFKFILRVLAIQNNPTVESLDNLLSLLQNRNTLNLMELPVLRAYARFKRHRDLIRASPVLPCFTFSLDSQSFTPNIILDKGKAIKGSRQPTSEFQRLFHSSLSSAVAFYTDGSKINQGSYVGLAIHAPNINLNLQFRISSFASIATAEALAIQLALEYIHEHNIQNSIIFTDSLSTLQAISSLDDFISSPIASIFHIKKLLSSSSLNVSLAWIPSHLGIPGNEKADLLAKEATASGTLLNFSLPHSDFFPHAHSLIHSEFNNFLSNYRTLTGCDYFSNYRLSSPKPWFHSCFLERQEITTICRMRSNHYNLASSLFKISLVDTPRCSCEEDVEDLNHVFWACSRFDTQRKQLVRSLAKSKNFPPFTISSFLFDPRNDIIKILLRFLTDCQLSI